MYPSSSYPFGAAVATRTDGDASAFDTALVSLDLAVVYLGQGRTAEVKDLALGMVAIFKAQRVHQEALAAALVFEKAARRENATIELARRLADYLRRAKNEPGLRFRG